MCILDKFNFSHFINFKRCTFLLKKLNEEFRFHVKYCSVLTQYYNINLLIGITFLSKKIYIFLDPFFMHCVRAKTSDNDFLQKIPKLIFSNVHKKLKCLRFYLSDSSDCLGKIYNSMPSIFQGNVYVHIKKKFHTRETLTSTL